MLLFNVFRFLICRSGLLQDFRWKQLVLLFSLLAFTDANLRNKIFDKDALPPATARLDAHAMPELSLPSNLPLLHKSHQNHLSPYGAPTQPPNYGHFVISAPPSSSRLSKPSMKKSASPRGLSEIAPTQPEPSTLPAGLAQPPLSPSISSKIGVLISNFKTLMILISASVCILLVGCFCIFILTNGVSKEMKLRATLISHLDARRKAEASNNYKSQFLANMSHELRTPMAAVIGLLDILMSDDCLTTEKHAMITQIRKCSTALLRLLNNILDISKENLRRSSR